MSHRHATLTGGAKGDVIHNMVGVVVINLSFKFIQHLTNVGFFKPHAQTFTLEL
ncbi:hypothetical protein D3C75_1265260 [compost metagenome]